MTLRANLEDVKAMLATCFAPSARVGQRLDTAVDALMHGKRVLRASHIAVHLLRRPLPSFRSVGYLPVSSTDADAASAADADGEGGTEPALAAAGGSGSGSGGGGEGGGGGGGGEGGGRAAAALVRLQGQLTFLLERLDAVLAVPLPPHADAPSAAAAAPDPVNIPLSPSAERPPPTPAERLARCGGRRGLLLLQHASLLHHGHEDLDILTAAAKAKRRQLKSAVRRLVQPRPLGGDGAAPAPSGEVAAAEGLGYLEAAGKALRGWLHGPPSAAPTG